jgi:hypothetical protein
MIKATWEFGTLTLLLISSSNANRNRKGKGSPRKPLKEAMETI